MARYAREEEQIVMLDPSSSGLGAPPDGGAPEPAVAAKNRRVGPSSVCGPQAGPTDWMGLRVCATRSARPLPSIASSLDAAARFREFLGEGGLLLQEVFCALYVDARNRPIGFKVITIGSVSSAPVAIPDVFRAAFILPTPAIVLCHNHPSGDVTPSAQDMELTKRIIEAAQITGLRILDHLVIAGGSREYVSFLDMGLMTR